MTATDVRFATPGDRERHRADLDEVLGQWVATFDSAHELEACGVLSDRLPR
jgi:crotonobetainyl-CoA:carnitine CoA-transferase CaiB-like acyl-CoA transferase